MRESCCCWDRGSCGWSVAGAGLGHTQSWVQAPKQQAGRGSLPPFVRTSQLLFEVPRVTISAQSSAGRCRQAQMPHGHARNTANKALCFLSARCSRLQLHLQPHLQGAVGASLSPWASSSPAFPAASHLASACALPSPGSPGAAGAEGSTVPRTPLQDARAASGFLGLSCPCSTSTGPSCSWASASELTAVVKS